MGLDMYLKGEKFYWTTNDPKNELKEDGFRVTEKILRLGYWRKHPNLHGYIVNTFNKGVDDCRNIYLDIDDCISIMRAIKENKLPHTEGFFFGQSDWNPNHDKESLEIFEKAIKWAQVKEKE